MKLILALISCVFVLSCSKSTSPVLTPIQDAGCAIETAVSGGLAGAVSTALSCTNPQVVAQQLQSAFGNANLCSAPVPAPAAQAMVAGAQPKYSKVGDVSASDLNAAKAGLHANLVKAQGVVGSVACPIAINAAVGFLSNSVPAAWGCSGPNATISGLVSALTTACIAAVPL